MAITSFTLPDFTSPAHNKINLVFESNKITEKGFRFILRIEHNSIEIARLSIPPRFGDGLGYADVSRICQNIVSYYNPINIALFQDGIVPQFDDVLFSVGEEYQVAYTYSQPQQNGLYVELNGTSATTFIAGDQININQADGGLAMPQLQGLFTVVSVSGNDVTINVLWADITPSVVAGSVTYVDGRKTQFLNQNTQGMNVFNSAYSFKDFQSYQSTDWILADGFVKPMQSNLPSTFTIKPTQDLFVWTRATELTGVTMRVQFQVFGDAGLEGTFLYNADTVNSAQMVKIAGDLTGITVISGILPVIKPTSKRVIVTFRNDVGTVVANGYTLVINRDCSIEDYEILFLDRLGSWGSFAFPLKAKGQITAQKKAYEQELGTIANTGFSYELDNVGKEVYNVSAGEELTLTTAVLSDTESRYFEELITSPKCFIKIDGEYYGCEVTTDTTPKDKRINTRLVRKTINVRLNEIYING